MAITHCHTPLSMVYVVDFILINFFLGNKKRASQVVPFLMAYSKVLCGQDMQRPCQ